jgi:flavin-dependent dehydrogenase
LSENKTDILIIGGGIAGCIAAISLAHSFNVTLIDKLSEPKERIGESLAPAANRILSELDLLEGMEAHSPSVFKQNLGMQSYWGSDRVQIVDHLRNPDGFVKSLDRKEFEVYLRKAAEERGVTCLWGTSLYSSMFEENEWVVQVRSGNDQIRPISARYVIDASGRQAHFARSIGIRREVLDKLLACWATLPNQEENTMSTISSCSNGWWYSSVVPSGKRIIAFHTDSDLIEKSDLKSTSSFVELARENEHMKHFLNGSTDSIEFQGTTAANSSKLSRIAGKQWAAIGDAAISFDPLSSQGMFNAMASAMQLKRLISEFGFGAEVSAHYKRQVQQIWEHYLKHRNLFYGAETRWDHEFWARRRLLQNP